MSQNLRDLPYSKGFVLAQEDFRDPAHFSKVNLPSGWFLWKDEAVKTDIATFADDFIIVRGHWVDTSEEAQEDGTAQQLMSVLRTTGEIGFLRRLARFGGRFVLIVRHDNEVRVYNDATGLRSVYYSNQRPLVASHLHLLNELDHGPRTHDRNSTIRALDATPYPHIRQLLPNFRLDPTTSSVERFFPFEPNRFTTMSNAERLQEVEKIWKRVMDYYLDQSNNLAISITGGLDSKLTMAMCGSSSNRFHAYTYGVSNAQSASAKTLEFDIEQVKSMLPVLDVRSHQFLDITEKEPLSESLDELIQFNTWGKHGQYLVPLYRKMFPEDNWFHLRGTGVEIIRRYWAADKTDLESLLSVLRKPGTPPLEERAKRFGYHESQYGYNLMDLLYWEIRMGKWHAEILNEQDAAFETFLPISVRDIYELLLAFSLEEREQATAVWELINRNYPVLNFWGANRTDNLYEQWRDERIERANASPDPENTFSGLELKFKKGDFQEDNTRCLRIYETPSSGALKFTINQPYRKTSAAGHFEWQVLLDGTAVVKCDGAITMTPTTVTLWNLPQGSTLEISLRSMRSIAEKSRSWESASLTTIDDGQFFPTNIDGGGELRVGCDNPFATILNTHEESPL